MTAQEWNPNDGPRWAWWTFNQIRGLIVRANWTKVARLAATYALAWFLIHFGLRLTIACVIYFAS